MQSIKTLFFGAIVALLWAAPAMAQHFHVVNKLPAKNVCKGQNELPPDLYDDLNKAVNDVIKSGVIGDIDKTVDKTLSDNKIGDTNTVDVEVNIATDADSYLKAMHDAGTNRSDADMKDWFGKDVAHTDTVGHGKNQKIVIFIFCGEHLKTRLLDGNAARTIVHELVHAQLYAMSLRGLPPDKEPYKEDDNKKFVEDQGRTGHGDEHNVDFNKIVERLTKLFDDDMKKQAEKPKVTEKSKGKTKSATSKPKKKPRRSKAPAEEASAPSNSGISIGIGVNLGKPRERHERREPEHERQNNSGFNFR